MSWEVIGSMENSKLPRFLVRKFFSTAHPRILITPLATNMSISAALITEPLYGLKACSRRLSVYEAFLRFLTALLTFRNTFRRKVVEFASSLVFFWKAVRLWNWIQHYWQINSCSLIAFFAIFVPRFAVPREMKNSIQWICFVYDSYNRCSFTQHDSTKL